VRDGNAPLRHDQLHVPQAQAEHVIQPDRVADDLRREAVSRLGGGVCRHTVRLPRLGRPDHRL
jgi:hypothetical protein